ncbi:adenylate/guanylate cyclase domain-containing protein [Pseudodesulfovibrio sp.]|uniref:adenylate/guanylate cyclase domain-containing protein n=1 Tax=unclassified Pseudodesulfovibrio TaxID=2661612 RepID=UPI003AFF6C0D
MRTLKRFTLRVTLLTLITVLLAGTVLALSSYNYIRNTRAAKDIAGNLLQEANEKAIIQIDAMISPILALGKRIQELPGLESKPLLLDHPAAAYLMETLSFYPYIYSVFMGYDDDDFYQIILLQPGETTVRNTIKAPPDARFAFRRIMRRDNGSRVEIWRFLNESRQTVGSRHEPDTVFRPTVRPWYAMAFGHFGLAQSDPYPFFSCRTLGLTVAHRFDGQVSGVFGVDITLSAISRFLARQHISKHGFAFLFNKDGMLLAHPDASLSLRETAFNKGSSLVPAYLDDLDDPIIAQVSRRFTQTDGRDGTFSFMAGGHEYLGCITKVPDSLKDGYMAVVAPASDFTEAIVKTRRDNLLFALLVLALVMPIIVILSRRISNRLQDLSREANRIREFDLEVTPKIRSHIKEIDLLARSVGGMKIALRSFGQYVPSTLVAKIVSGELEPRLGGSRRPLTVLFTDIADFTSISEAADPEELMGRVSVYFKKLSSVILSHNGTIDKFIGDAIMAFWNAPSRDGEHVRHACVAALYAARASNTQNKAWRAEGKPELFTRFGLHTGECIVGNVGSSDRMDYTAMGDTVNMASRLEGLNKYLGTQILVSREVREQAGEGLVFRAVGRVIPKGKHIPTDIYELAGFAAHVDEKWYTQWETAYDSFMARDFADAAQRFALLLESRPDDPTARSFAERASRFRDDPPSETWDGTEKFTAK